MSQAESKPFKVGEPLTEMNGNPEPSTVIEILTEACVETGRRVCIKCGGEIPSTKYSNAKYCSDRCRSAYISYRHCLKVGKFKSPGVGSGGDQEGEKNPNYKTGIGTYSKKAFKHYGRVCNRCGSVDKLLVHHQDENRENNSIENLEVLCKGCHQRHHETRNALGQYTQRDSPHQQETVG